MAKLKVKGIQDFIQTDNVKAKRIKSIWMDESVDRGFKIEVGNLVITKGDITMVVTDKDEELAVNQEQVAYDKGRKEKIAWPIEKKLEFQRKYFELVKSITKTPNAFEFYMEDTKKFLEEHPNRLWCDPRVWSLGKEDKRQVSEYEAAALKVIFMVDANEKNEERRAEKDKETLAIFGR